MTVSGLTQAAGYLVCHEGEGIHESSSYTGTFYFGRAGGPRKASLGEALLLRELVVLVSVDLKQYKVPKEKSMYIYMSWDLSK